MKKNKNPELIKERNDKIKQFLIDMIAPAIFLIFVIVVLVIINTKAKEKTVDDMPEVIKFDDNLSPVVLENSYLKFEMDPLTTMFTVTDKSTGVVWSSNPDLSKETALEDEKNKLRSLFMLQYSGQTGRGEVYDSYTKSIGYKDYLIERGNDQVTVKFTVGKVAKEYYIPPVAYENNFLDYIEQIKETKGEEVAKEVASRYTRLDLEEMKAAGEDYEEKLARYPSLETDVIYVLRDNLKDRVKEELLEAFDSIGYGFDQYAFDATLDTQVKVSENPLFNLSIVFKLEDNKLKVSIPFDSIENPKKYPVYKISLLPYFGAGSTEEDGFLFVPEGGGAIINFNNKKNTLQSYSSRVYGWDLCLVRDSIVHDPITNFGVFGVSKKAEKASFICIPEEGASYATIQADISGRTNMFNYVYAEYDVYQREQYDVGNISSTDIFKYIEKLPEGESLTQSYIFVNSDSYVDMAAAYEKYLKAKYGESYFKLNTDTSTPVNVELIGAVDKTEQILGIPVSRPLELTTFEEAGQIADEISAAGLKNVTFKYTGWCNGGVQQTVLSSIKPLSKLGGKSDLKEFSEKVSGLGYKLALNGITTLALDSNIFDGFFSFTDAAKNISEERMELHKYSAVTYALREGSETFYLLHTKLILEYADNLVEKADGFNAGVSFEDIGKDIPSDFYEDDYHSRENVRQLHIDLLKKYDDAGKYVVINTGNDYAIPYVDLITNMDLSGSDYSILDHNVPFLELAIHGYVNYTGESLNICGDQQDEILYSAAYGAGLSFTFMKESAFTLQDTLYTHYYGCDYDKWKDEMFKIYDRFNKELGHVYNQKMVDHEILRNGVTCTTYEDGTKVYVNFNYEDFYGREFIKARDYKVVPGQSK